FGRFQATLNDEPLGGFRTAKVQALLVCLAAEPTKPLRRESLMLLLWPGMPERSARQNLRQIIYNLRRAVPDLPQKSEDGENEIETAVPLLLANRHTVRLNPLADVSSDVARFEMLIESTQAHDHLDILLCHDCRRNLETAVALYQGDFLADFYLDDSNEFEAWAEIQRQRYRRQALDALEILTAMAAREASYATARAYAEQQIEIDDLRESAYRQLMEVLALNGQRTEALAVYERFSRLLAEELNMAPAARTTERYEQIRAGDLDFTSQAARGVRGLELKEKIGEGTLGVVHRAVQPVVGREVAVKVIRHQYADDPEFIRRFEAEAQVIARLEHPYIVPLYDYWREPDGAYLVMRLLRGGNLLASLENGPWDLEPTMKMVDQITSALAVAHRQGVVHLDIKPANILLDEAGNAYLSDFGIARQIGGSLQLTAAGAMLGTPDYISPEQLRDEAVSPQSDVYSLGAVLYETLTGERPFSDLPLAIIIQKQLHEPIPPVSAGRPGLPRQIDAVLQRATAKQPADRYDNVLALAEAFRQALHGGNGTSPSIVVDVSVPIPIPAEIDVANPYKGLRAFQETDAADFYGREKLVEQLVEHFCESRFVAVVGPSGSGKSSVVKAGLIPALRQGAIKGSEAWFVAEMVPGERPLEELALALLPVAVDPPPSLVEPMQKDKRGMLRTIRRILPNEENAQLLLVIDQFEELFTLVEDEERRAFFLDSLLAAIMAPRSPLRVLITLRADFYDRPLQVQLLGQWIKENTEIVLPMTAEELTWAIQEPARRAGVKMEKGLTPAIVADVINEPGALPLLQYAMTELFDERQNEVMTRAAYEEVGGVLSALGRRAEENYNCLNPAQQEAARQMFLRLVTLGEGVEDTRRRVLRSELEGICIQLPVKSEQSAVSSQPSADENPTSDIEKSAIYNPQSAISNPKSGISGVIDLFGRYRLLTFDRDPLTRGATVEVAHEALLRQWPRLRAWLDESRSDIRLQRLLAVETAEWQKAGEGEAYLLRGARLDQYAGWPEEAAVSLTDAEQAFLAASFAARDRRREEEEARRQRELETARQLAETEKERAEEQAQAAGRLRRRAAFLAGALAVAALLAVAAIFFARQSSANAQAAGKSAIAAQENADLAATSEAQAVAEADARATAQVTAEENEQQAVAAAAEAQAAQKDAEEQREVAEGERQMAAEQARLARSRELGAQSARLLPIDPELAMLLAREALTTQSTFEARNALHAAVLGSRLRGRLPAHQASIAGIAYSPDGELMVTTSDDETAKVWRVADNELLFETPISIVNGGVLLPAVFSPDNTRLVTLDPGESFSLAVWDTDTWQRLETIDLPLSMAGMTAYSISSDLSQAAVGYEDGAVYSWDLKSREQLASLTGYDGWVEPFYSPDGTLLATYSSDGDAGKVILWDPVEGTSDKQVDFSGSITFITLSPDNRWLAVASGDEILLWDLAELTGGNKPPDAVLRGQGAGIYGLQFTPDSQQLATGGRDQTARLWDIPSGQELLTLGHDTVVGSLNFTPDGTQLVTSDDRGDLRFWDLTALGESELSSIDVGDVNYADVSPDGKILAAGYFDGLVKLWDLETGQEIQVFEGHDDTVSVVDFHPQLQQIATASMDGTARVWDMLTGKELLRMEGHEVGSGFYRGVLGLDYSPDGRIIATSGTDGKVRTWDAATGEPLLFLDDDEEEEWVTRVSFSPDGGMMATAGELSDITIWDPQTGQELFAFPAALPGRDIVWGLDFTPDSRMLAVSGTGGLTKLWTIDKENARSELFATLSGHTGIVFRTDLLSDGQLLATSGGGDTRLWDLSKLDDLVPGESISTSLIVPGDNPRFNLEGDELMTTKDGVLRVYTLDDERLLALTDSRLTRQFSADECARFSIDPCPDVSNE
ncbi:MAG: protein kinase domain-containing protein, partial [Candidatus Promineifilaceae bacterium]